MSVKLRVTGKKTNATVKQLYQVAAMPDVITVGINVTNFRDLLTGGVPIDDFIGFVEVLKSKLTEDVPITFPNSETFDDDGNSTGQRTWHDYCNYHENVTNALLTIGAVGSNGNRGEPVKDEELQVWVTEFGKNNILTLSEGKALITSDYTSSEL